MSSVRLPYPYPELLQVKRLCSVGYVQNHTREITRTRNFYKLLRSMYARGTIPGVRVYLCQILWCGYGYGYNIRVHTLNFCEFCKNSIPVPGTSVSYVTLPYPYPEYTSPTKHNLGNITRSSQNMIFVEKLDLTAEMSFSCFPTRRDVVCTV